MVYYLCKTACLNKMSKLNVDPNKFGPDRYQMPPVDVRSQKNNKTYFTNIEDISKDLNRTSEELLKFLGYHLNTQTNTSQNSFNGVYTTEKMQESVYDYILPAWKARRDRGAREEAGKNERARLP